MARILTVKQVAKKLQMKPVTVREYLRKGKIPGRKLGRAWLVVEIDLEQFISGRPSASTGERVSALGICTDIPGYGTEAFLKNKQDKVSIEEKTSM